ncbi:unnamed protein product [Eretmochelys imbricata]
MALPACGVITASPHDPAAGSMASLVRLLQARKFVALQSTLPAPRLFLDRLSAHQGDTAMLSCLVPLDAHMTRIVFCKDGKEISVQRKEGNKLVYDSPYTVSRERTGTFSCRYQLKDDNNQENNSLSSDPWDLHVDGGDGSGGDASPQDGPSPSGRLGPIVGLAIMAGLALALLGCFLMKTVVSRCRTHREPGPDRSSPAAEDPIQSSAQPNDKVTGAMGHGQERDWLEPGSFCHKLQGATPTTPTGCGSQPMEAAELALGAGAACGAPWLPLCIGVMGGHAAFSRCCTEPGQTPWSLEPALTRILSAPQACMSPTLAASLIGAPGKEMVMEPVNQPARTSVWVNR